MIWFVLLKKTPTEESDLYKCQSESLEMNQDVDQELTTLKVRSAITQLMEARSTNLTGPKVKQREEARRAHDEGHACY